MMTPEPGSLTAIEHLLYLMECSVRPLNFAIILYFNQQLEPAVLLDGARVAAANFPVARSILKNGAWVPACDTSAITSTQSSNGLEAQQLLQPWINAEFDISRIPPVQQQIIDLVAEQKTVLASKFHHAAADGMSAALWLCQQMKGNVRGNLSDHPLTLRTIGSYARKSKYSFTGPSDRLHRENANASSRREWLTITIPSDELKRHCASAGGSGFTYNDLLATVMLQTLKEWNQEHGRSESKIGIWLPVNIRKHRCAGFGNGTSRIRIYARWPKGASLHDKCRSTRMQIQWCLRNGEWHVPAFIHRYSKSLIASSLLRLYLRRPWIDMGTACFSHVENFPGHDQFSRTVESVDSVGLLHSRHSLAVNGLSYAGKTFLTFTHDPAQLSKRDIVEITEIFQKTLRM